MGRRYRKFKNSRFVELLGLLLFSAFSFTFLYCLQGDLLSEAQYVFSKGVTSYTLLPGAIIITIVLLIIQWITKTLLRFDDSYYMLSYFPSCLVLALITGIDEGFLLNPEIETLYWLVPLVLLVYAIIVLFISKLVMRENPNANKYIHKPIWLNCIILLCMFLYVGSYANNNDIFTYELKVERLLLNGEYKEATEVGNKSLRSSRRLTELRLYALAKANCLGDKLFDYPQYYGTKGLIDLSDSLSPLYRITSRDICKSMSFIPVDSTTEEIFLETSYRVQDSLNVLSKNVASEDDNAVHIDSLCSIMNPKMVESYYLSYLLLDKDLDRFCSVVELDSSNVLPKAYGEAVVLAFEQHLDSISTNKLDASILENLYKVVDTLTINERKEYMEMKYSITNDVERMNKLRRKYGNTYWWYYEYSDSVLNPTY